MARQSSESQMTIFFNGRVCVCDVTELQARTIIWLARKEMDQKKSKTAGLDTTNIPSPQSQIYSPPGLSMKKSLQRFLQRRKDRIQGRSSPYNNLSEIESSSEKHRTA
ncbi:protein TIFY 5A-like [Cornus florida]|uniref:protein TIFY 5A-like n=1 Tax=Cornus florida TaxID=4283 RepID=UPI0028996769|nr:protein TIFY 5A-like [Cornus florida]